ncbi:MAG: carboxylating nicotinate-nucleotide diphosphorylase [Methermicoccaceae archaeon]
MLKYELESLIDEDVGWAQDLFDIVDGECDAVVYACENGVVAGVCEAREVFSYLGLDVESLVQDGSCVRENDTIMRIRGNANRLLMAERLALNLMGKMSGIATLTRRCVDALRGVGSDMGVACTRKTTPGFRRFEKRAVVLGGGDAHRFNLSEAIILKDNHLKLISIEEGVRRARRLAGVMRKVEVEVESVDDAIRAARAGADVIMFDNMHPNLIREGVEQLIQLGLREHVLLEASGNITCENITSYAHLGLDFVSVGAIVHSAPLFDVKLEVVSSQGHQPSR